MRWCFASVAAVALQQPRASLRQPPATAHERLTLTADGVVYDVTDFEHPGGRELLLAHAGEDVTHLVASNHRRPANALRAARVKRHGAGGSYFDRGADLYDALKREVRAAVGDPPATVAAAALWPYAARVACVVACQRGCAPVFFAILYGLLLGRSVWTVTHEYVHAPARWPRWVRVLHALDFANVGAIWLAEHHRHHAATNRDGDPDRRWFEPVVPGFDSLAADRRRGGLGVLLKACVVYPLLPLFMVARVPARGDGDDAAAPRTRAARRALAIGARARAAAAPTTQDEWLVDQIASTNDVRADGPVYTWLTGGINCHSAHHLFPNLPGAKLGAATEVLRRFSARHGLPYRNFSPAGLWGSHASFLLGRRAPEERRCPVAS
ncbi:tRNA methyltransferase [Aureococcus anophagefferens]|uniref:tRNA methyltransferase n=1 Tax=Aureococcus anophagefferens TaxID=44056 RepID=A0ABR1FI97_AURAN